jgi:hypothetical protein
MNHEEFKPAWTAMFYGGILAIAVCLVAAGIALLMRLARNALRKKKKFSNDLQASSRKHADN